ncbi:MAG: hypothetical protein VR65_28155 [Desulfobulbaceae bacterium BRH_c16a]|nr:MAG: hypothetical protein VR65_28155 [Desulfobulbaceae bacterium BRH_c16a]
MTRIIFPLLLLFLLAGCREESMPAAKLLQCTGCHAVELDTNHELSCITCHRGNNEAQDKETAHIQLIARPAHPDSMGDVCGPCHGATVAGVIDSQHFTLKNSTNTFREVFGAEKPLTNFLEVPVKENPENILELADDLLRRRCFRCHPYSPGDNYPAVGHGVGCSACHLSFFEGKLQSHTFQKPQDQQCLSCHYGNYVGFDYYGRFEHDYNAEYRTPYTTKNAHFRPFGVEYHQLVPDIHQQKGLVCVDCHSGQELMRDSAVKPSCAACHSGDELAKSLPPRVERREKDAFVLLAGNGKEHPIPLLQHPAHFNNPEKITCQACHAQWTFNDISKHYLRSDVDDVDPWTLLATQGSFEVENLVEHNSDFNNTELPLQMTDKITRTPRQGLWLKGFTMRRWEEVVLGRDRDGAIATMRPMLDYSLSWIDEEENVRFDSLMAIDNMQGLRPYVPHTTGPAGVFYRERIDNYLKKEQTATTREFYTLLPRRSRPRHHTSPIPHSPF